MAISIAWFGSEGSTPYRRIILGLSLSDILQSLAFLTGPLSVPPSKMSREVENEAVSCQANGFIGQIGGTAVVLHTVFLCVYYLYKFKYRMSNEAFEYKIERKLRVVIIILTLIAGIVPLVMDAFHTNSIFYSLCYIDKVPTGCWKEPDIVGECDPMLEKHFEILTMTFVIGFVPLCFFIIIVIMCFLYHYAFFLNKRIEREVSIPTTFGSKRTSEEEQSEDDEDIVGDDEIGEETPQDRVLKVSRLYKREMIIQATSYVVAFCMVYIPMVIVSFFAENKMLHVVTMIFYPLGGFLNILVFTRPKVAFLRRNHPQLSRLRGFWLVLKTGGEIPDDSELTNDRPFCSCCRPSTWLESEEFDEYSSSSREYSDRGANQWRTTFGIHLSRIGF
eukprot:CAMPEP_0204629964 /NCGR_PEP_ID=MMETSP0717-20131115/19333_1 /ASSEMBLY_ACC=CAM_ASM_000666 /TAXON_ID=230516 /ORGANISM="Chaetoceros curvisetus" /LENGTH=389 /DNA_ID=CAMNT_0051647061 /DNA_START=53 /DNA_END=1222 /DNA_ORIENTATION=+